MRDRALLALGYMAGSGPANEPGQNMSLLIDCSAIGKEAVALSAARAATGTKKPVILAMACLAILEEAETVEGFGWNNDSLLN
jgi:hypothetical protein|tara:strand:- start:4457 stop:4705 length:249 start_codon:yes stop_codon:yes gene_type:complete